MSGPAVAVRLAHTTHQPPGESLLLLVFINPTSATHALHCVPFICRVASLPPSSAPQCTNQLQKEAADLTNRADTELQGLVDELTRVHGLVASFQDQIREVSRGWEDIGRKGGKGERR